MTYCLCMFIISLIAIIVIQQYFWKQDLDSWGHTIELLNKQSKDEK